MTFVKEGHLGGYVRSGPEYPHGDPLTYCTKVWDWIVSKYRPDTVLDVGCGEGHAVSYLRKAGLSAFGIDGCCTALESGVADPDWLIEHDYTRGALERLPLPGFDAIWCCEFVEHVAEEHSENFLKTFDLSRLVFMTHAFPGQEGHHHVNCREPDYWIGRMKAKGYRVDERASRESRALDPEGHWGRSGLIFVKTEGNQ